MITIVMLFAVGVLSILVEFFIPAGGIVGAVGLGSLIASVVVSFLSYGEAVGVFVLLGVLILAPTAMVFYFKVFPKSFIGKRFILGGGDSSPELALPDGDSSLVGLAGKASTDLRPSGIARVGTRSLNVVTSGEYITRGSDIEIVEVLGNQVFVKGVE